MEWAAVADAELAGEHKQDADAGSHISVSNCCGVGVGADPGSWPVPGSPFQEQLLLRFAQAAPRVSSSHRC